MFLNKKFDFSLRLHRKYSFFARSIFEGLSNANMLLAILSCFESCVDHVFSSSMIEPGSYWRTSSFSRKQPGGAWTCWCPTTAHSMGSIWSFNLCWCLTWCGGYLGRCWELVGIEGKKWHPPSPTKKVKTPTQKGGWFWIMKMKQSVGTTNHPTQDAGSSPPGWHEPFLKLKKSGT